MASEILAICYVDLVGNLTHTACGLPFDQDVLGATTEAMRAPFITMFLSSVTCPYCREINRHRLARVPQPGSASAVSASSRTLRTSSGVLPAPLTSIPAP